MVHRDVQASSILLDDKFDVRLGSLSKVCPQEGEGHQNVITKLLRFSSTADQGSSGEFDHATFHCSHAFLILRIGHQSSVSC
ncbi:putative LRR receptor-like serine/threonine-protein kinase [Zea mays]|uniref:Putative LRR receptor-like serine/threonine-protein kinase n=1 Tax=Zea mays TaxID=4577 RepID=A0A1D6GII9_MAIZE|nr:putative LRR receptor-like serine/threonine-protein kinase [Zea mays]